MPIKGLKPHTHKADRATMPLRVCNGPTLRYPPTLLARSVSTRFIAPFQHFFLPSHIDILLSFYP